MFFKPEQFVATEFDTAEQKAKFANHFRDFILRGFDHKYFVKWFYTRLSMTFGHIANYDIHGFWDVFFTNTSNKLAFLMMTRDHGGYGDPKFTYSDVERDIKEWLNATTLIEMYREMSQNESESSEKAQLARLKAKYE